MGQLRPTIRDVGVCGGGGLSVMGTALASASEPQDNVPAFRLEVRGDPGTETKAANHEPGLPLKGQGLRPGKPSTPE